MKDAFFKYAGVLCIPVYVIFTFISHLCNTRINPLTNWLSDYGNPLENPSGALFYNMGCIIIAVLLGIFYIGLYRWYAFGKTGRKYVICFVCAQISGIAHSVFLVLAAVFPLGTDTGLHSTFSTVNMIGIDCFMNFTAIAFLISPDFKRWVGIFAFLSAIFNIVTMNAFSSLYISEWIYFLLFMIYIVIITLNYDKIIDVHGGKHDRVYKEHAKIHRA